VAVVGEPLQKIPAKDVIFRDLTPKEGAWVPPGSRMEYPLPSFLNSSTCWLKPVPAETGAAPWDQSETTRPAVNFS